MTQHDGSGRSELAAVEDWLVERSKGLNMAPLEHIEPDLDLVDSGLIDSLRLIEFTFLLGQASGTEIAVDQVSVDKFRTLRRISENFFDATPAPHRER